MIRSEPEWEDDLSSDLKQRVASELEEGERVIWTGRPLPGRLRVLKAIFVAFGLVSTVVTSVIAVSIIWGFVLWVLGLVSADRRLQVDMVLNRRNHRIGHEPGAGVVQMDAVG